MELEEAFLIREESMYVPLELCGGGPFFDSELPGVRHRAERSQTSRPNILTAVSHSTH